MIVTGTKEPLQMLRIYNRMSSISGVAEQSVVDKSARLRNEMAVNVYGDLVITSSEQFFG